MGGSAPPPRAWVGFWPGKSAHPPGGHKSLATTLLQWYGREALKKETQASRQSKGLGEGKRTARTVDSHLESPFQLMKATQRLLPEPSATLTLAVFDDCSDRVLSKEPKFQGLLRIRPACLGSNERYTTTLPLHRRHKGDVMEHGRVSRRPRAGPGIRLGRCCGEARGDK